MAPIEAPIALSRVSGGTRARELYKYYQPDTPINSDVCFPARTGSITPPEDAEPAPSHNITSNIASSKISSADTALTAFCQLVTWRIGTERAMISLIDEETQYFVAESTKTVDLIDNTQHAPGDEIWIGCDSVSKAGRLCERTIEVAPPLSGYPCFIVNDLTQDERFNQLPFVTGSPFLKFYAGVPLITKRGIPIGSLFVVDSHVRADLSKQEVHFMGTMAGTIMRHFEQIRQVEEHRRGMKMSHGLASFVEGRSELVEPEVEAEETEDNKVPTQVETDIGTTRNMSRPGSIRGSTHDSVASNRGSVSSSESREKEYSTALAKTEEAIRESHRASDPRSIFPILEPDSQLDPLSRGSVTSPKLKSPDQIKPSTNAPDESSKIIFSRAANLIREAFELDGGTVFYDAQRGFGESPMNQKVAPGVNVSHDESQNSSDELQSSSEQLEQKEQVKEEQRHRQATSESGRQYSAGLDKGIFSRSSTNISKTVEVLGFSTAEASSTHNNELQSFIPFDEKTLHALLRRYPRGKLWTFDSDGAVSSSSEEEITQLSQNDRAQNTKDLHNRKVKNTKAKSDAKFLLRHFPGVRQLLFVPLWDARRSCWFSSCFAWSIEPTRILSKTLELAFLVAFGNSVMAECSRIDTEIADDQKTIFIGSVSHELRSPLHGILASAEFLEEEVSTGFEKSLVATIDSCGRTLLDTINHILDFSKINHFEKNWKKNRRGGNRTMPHGPLALRRSDIPMINLFADVDVSVVCEEVVEGVFAGHVFQNETAQTFDMVQDAREKTPSHSKALPSLSNPIMETESSQHSEVAVILDVDMHNYHFTTQPGAFRRVIMNLLGNALKYTSHGYVRIVLEATEMEELQTPGDTESVQRSLFTVTVIDTGRGISPEFLRSKLFMPFSQENSLSSGTGLGLSIVRSIVAVLEGNITIESELGRGTKVKVTLPLLREMPKTADSNSSSTPKSMSSMTRDADESISLLRAQAIGRKVSLHGFDLDTKDPVVRKAGHLLQASIMNFLKNWYGLTVVPFGQKCNVIILNEAHSTTAMKILRQSTINGKAPAILVLCSHLSRSSHSSVVDSVGYVAKPVGPLKLARALIQCLHGAPPTSTPSLFEPTSGDGNDLSTIFEELSLSPHRGEVLDNSRMSADSQNARKAIESPTPSTLAEKHQEYPFPVEAGPPISKSRSVLVDKESLKPVKSGDVFESPSAVHSRMEKISKSSGSEVGTAAEPTSSPSSQDSLPQLQSPCLLLVDDNMINLRLLRTYLRKRNYDVVDEAENGLEAVKKVERREQGYDIIFMDISMPILDGFGATRQIRAIEAAREMKAREKNTAERTPALVIALTGLASIRDQNEAFAVGIDLFLTKPVAFKEVGKLLDNWEANRERDSRGGVSEV